MAVTGIPVPPDQKHDARATELVSQVGSWPLFILKQQWGSFEPGTVFRRAPSSAGNGSWYLVNAVACQCPDYRDWGHICKHIRAVVLGEACEAAAKRPAPRLRYQDLVPACAAKCGDLVERAGETCYACASDEARRLEMAAKRDAFGLPIPPFTLNPLAE